MSWIRSTEYQNIKDNLRDYSVKQTAVYFDRAIGTIYQIKNTKNHKEYCKQYNQRQYEAEYATKIPFKPSKLLNRWLDDSGIVGAVTYPLIHEGKRYPNDNKSAWRESVERRLAKLERQVKAIEYLVREK